MLRNRYEWAIWIVVAALLGGGWIVLSKEDVRQAQTPTLTEAPIVGHLAPDFTLPTVLGETHTLSAYRGQPVVLNFWASWCGPCRVEMPFFTRAQMKFNGRATILGVNQGESLTTVRDFATRQAIGYPLLVDDDNDVNLRYTINSLPTTIFVDADGVVREVIVGVVSQAVLEDRISSLLAEKP
ncbi:MAG: TlpA family protein disulfide reductase [Chloroflexi bacterium]|nr:TlpA family protein disulfide reductase [Chloroflexota bacterium]